MAHIIDEVAKKACTNTECNNSFWESEAVLDRRRRPFCSVKCRTVVNIKEWTEHGTFGME